MPVVFKDYRVESRSQWGAHIDQNKTVDREAIQLGAILRIADATELMASNYLRLQDDAEKYKRWYNQECESNRRMAKRIAALQGVITKMKKKVK